MERKNNQKTTSSKENYLKTILDLSNGTEVRSSRVAAALGVSKASVSCMMNRLKEDGYVTKEKYGVVTLTEKGYEEARKIQKRYHLLKRFLIKILEVDKVTAAEDACRMEHIISAQSIKKMDEHLLYWIGRQPSNGTQSRPIPD